MNIALSQIKAGTDQVWVLHARDNYLTSKIHIDPSELIRKIKQKEVLHRIEDDCLKSIPHFKIEYEEDLFNKTWDKTMSNLFSYLDLNAEKVETTMRKKSSGKFSDMIKNYDEVKDVLSREGYVDYISDTDD